MRTTKTLRSSRLLILTLVGFLGGQFGSDLLRAQGKGGYAVIRLAVPGAVTTESSDLNDSANVIGSYRDADNISYGFHYEQATGVYTSLDAPQSWLIPMTFAEGINQENGIVGYGYDGGLADRGLYWSSPTAEPIQLRPLAGHTHSRAVAINNSKLIVGQSYIPEDSPVTAGFRAVVAWYVDAEDNVVGPEVLPFLTGDIAGRPYDLTEAIDVGDGTTVTSVVGTSGNRLSGEDDLPLPVSWTVTIAESSLTVSVPAVFAGSYFQGDAYGVNNDGDAVGVAAFGEGLAGEPFLRRVGQSMIRLPMLSKAVSGHAASINDSGRIVGQQNVYQKGQGMLPRAVLWTNSTTVIDLNSQVSLGRLETLSWAGGINGRGDILAKTNGNKPCLLIAH